MLACNHFMCLYDEVDGESMGVASSPKDGQSTEMVEKANAALETEGT